MFSLMNIQLITVTVQNDHCKYVVKHQLHILGHRNQMCNY
jgi:hypothetical protein